MSKDTIISIQNEYGFILTVGMKVIPNPDAFAPRTDSKILTIGEFVKFTQGWCLKDGNTVRSISKYMPHTASPADFNVLPTSSIKQSYEHERIAANIMIILKRTGNKFRELSFKEYEKERRKDGGFGGSERALFEEVVDFCVSADKAALFAPSWKSVAESK